MDIEELKIWIPSAVSVIMLVLNMIFAIFLQPKLTYKIKRKEEYANIASELMVYIADLISFDNFNGVPTKIRNYSLKIHLCFKKGVAPKKIDDNLEKVFQEIKLRKKIVNDNEKAEWEKKFRELAKDLRVELSKYCGVLR